VREKAASRLWNGLVDRYHYLGYSPLPGAQMRYLIESDQGLLGALGFGAAAWKVGVRDAWIGWDRLQREARLGAVVVSHPDPQTTGSFRRKYSTGDVVLR
jgi:hypothetical protein